MTLPQHLRDAFGLLLQAHLYAHELACDAWDFAVEIDRLWAAGLTNSDLRWLLCKDLVAHAIETTRAGRDRRYFRPLAKLSVPEGTCVVLTAAGAQAARQLLGDSMPAGPAALLTPAGVQAARQLLGRPTPACPAAPSPVPLWNGLLRELRVGAQLVKHFKQPAPNQEIILTVFEEEGWPEGIDDPLPRRANHDAKRHLHDTINNLNRNQMCPLLHFSGDGRGSGVRWRFQA